jgi:putative aldouronate transport system substrate-binding protein
MLTVFLVLAACGNGNKNAESTKESSSSEPASTSSASSDTPSKVASELKPYKLKLVYEGPPQADEAKVEEALNKILTDKINATIDIVPIDWGAWDDKMNLMIASREPVDVMFTAQWNGYSKNVAKGAYKDIGELLQQYGQGIIESLDPAFLEGSKINGKSYAVPTNKELAAAGGFIYRKDIAEELGLDMTAVKSAEDLDAIYKVVKEKKPDMIPLYTTAALFVAEAFAEFDALGDSSAPGVIMKNSDDTTVRLMQETEIYKKNVSLARDYFVKGYINKDAATTQLNSNDAYKAGNVFSTIESIKPGKADENATATGLDGKLGQIMLTGKTVATTETAGAMLAISSTSEDPARAMMFINLLHTDKEIINLLNFGIEGEHYTLNGNIMTPTAQTAQYAPGVAWELGNQFLNQLWDTEDPQKWEKFKEFNSGAKSSPALGFVFNAETVKGEIGAIANVNKQYSRAVDTGSVDIDKVLPEFIKALKAAGSDKVVAEKQKQLDAFLASK